MKKQISILAFILLLFSFTGCTQSTVAHTSVEDQRAVLAKQKQVKPTRILDSLQIITDLEFLASEKCEGRRPGTEGHVLAMQRVLSRMREAGIDSFGKSLLQLFEARTIAGPGEGKNVIGRVKGTKFPDKYLVISAHYDHLGTNNKGLYHGADDNASGTACLLALAKYFKKNPQSYSIIFAAFDREESGLQGAFNFLSLMNDSVSSSIFLNINMDMIARSDNNEIFASGLKHYPQFRYAVDEVKKKSNTKLLVGHDHGNSKEDWTKLSDHYAFHKKNIPFIYIGVEDHDDYHKPTDTVDKINYSRYIENCNLVAMLAKAVRVP